MWSYRALILITKQKRGTPYGFGQYGRVEWGHHLCDGGQPFHLLARSEAGILAAADYSLTLTSQTPRRKVMTRAAMMKNRMYQVFWADCFISGSERREWSEPGRLLYACLPFAKRRLGSYAAVSACLI